MKQRKITIEERLYETSKRRDKYGAIIENIQRNRQPVPHSLAEKAISAEIDYAIAKDDNGDPWMRG